MFYLKKLINMVFINLKNAFDTVDKLLFEIF